MCRLFPRKTVVLYRLCRSDIAKEYYEYFVEQLADAGVKSVQTGVFGADMQVELVNDGPVTILLDSSELK